MNCKDVQENLTAYLHAELEKNELSQLHRHLGQCERCLKEEMEILKTFRMLHYYRTDLLPEDFDEKLFRKIKKLNLHQTKNQLRHTLYAVAAAILIFIGIEVFAYYIFSPISSQDKLRDYPTTRAIFKTDGLKDTDSFSWKEKYMKKYSGQFRQNEKELSPLLKIKRK
ncbi:zf-HC2 domain-containing protein [candidate division KSB1 bacterium]|nr:zf-HC2 domain-containing protein [candidate division KSB1 bacterium]